MKGTNNSDDAGRYGLPVDYVVNDVREAEEREQAVYWHKKRIEASRSFQWHVYDWASKYIEDNDVCSVVELGCGTAVKSSELIIPHVDKYVGIDRARPIEFCRQNYPSGRFLVDDLEESVTSLDFVPDFIVCSDVVEHLQDPDALLEFVRRLSSNETRILFSTPDRARLRGRDALASRNPSHVREWAADEFENYLSSRGFRTVEARHLPPLKIGLNRLTISHLVRQLRPGLSWRYNYAVLCQLGDSLADTNEL